MISISTLTLTATYSQLLLHPSVKLLSWLYVHMASPPSVRPFTGMPNSTRIIFGNLTCKFLMTHILLSFASFFCFPRAIMPVIILDFNMFRCSRLRSCLKCLKFQNTSLSSSYIHWLCWEFSFVKCIFFLQKLQWLFPRYHLFRSDTVIYSDVMDALLAFTREHIPIAG